MIGTKRRISKSKEQYIAELLLRRRASAVLHAEGDDDEANHPASQEPRFVFIREDKGGKLYLISNGRARVLKTPPEIASELGRHFSDMDDGSGKFDALVLPSHYVSARKLKFNKGHMVDGQPTEKRPMEYSAFRARLDDIIKSSDISRKAPSWRDFLRGLREIIQNESDSSMKVNER
jgi:hypothetical protein